MNTSVWSTSKKTFTARSRLGDVDAPDGPETPCADARELHAVLLAQLLRLLHAARGHVQVEVAALRIRQPLGECRLLAHRIRRLYLGHHRQPLARPPHDHDVREQVVALRILANRDL